MIFNYLGYLFSNLTAGLWNYVWHWGTAGFVIAVCLGLYFFVDYLLAVPVVRIFVEPIKQYRVDLLWVAVAAGVYMWGLAAGDRDAANRCARKEVVIEREVDAVVKDAKGAAAKAKKEHKALEDPYNVDN